MSLKFTEVASSDLNILFIYKHSVKSQVNPKSANASNFRNTIRDKLGIVRGNHTFLAKLDVMNVYWYEYLAISLYLKFKWWIGTQDFDLLVIPAKGLRRLANLYLHHRKSTRSTSVISENIYHYASLKEKNL